MQITKNTSNLKRATSIMLIFMLIFSMFIVADTERAFGKTLESAPAENVFFYVKNDATKDVLLKVMTLEELTTNLEHNNTTTGKNYYYSYTDNLPTTGYAEARGFTLMELLDYVKSNTTVKDADAITYAGEDTMRFMATDSFGRYNRNHKYCDLYGIKRYYFPELYDYWDSEEWETEYGSADNAYDTNPLAQEYCTEEKNTVFENGELTQPILATTSESGRTITDLAEAISSNKGIVTGCLVNSLKQEKALTLYIPQTEKVLRTGERTAMQNFKWIYNIRLDMATLPAINSLGTVAAPTCSVIVIGDTLSISMSCETEGADIYYAFDGSPQIKYTGEPVSYDITGIDIYKNPVTISMRAVKEGWDDAGIIKETYPVAPPSFKNVASEQIGNAVIFTASDSVTSEKWMSWVDSITGIDIKYPSANENTPISNNDEKTNYIIDKTEKTITFNRDLFNKTGYHTFYFYADGYSNRTGSRKMCGTAPVVQADTDGNYPGTDITLTFDDIPGWRQRVTVKVNNSTLWSNVEKNETGKITIKSEAEKFKTPGKYTITLQNGDYIPNTIELEQIIVKEPQSSSKVAIGEITRVDGDTESTVAVTSPESADNIASGTAVTLTVSPKEGMLLKADTLTVTYNDGTEKAVDLSVGENNTYTFTMPAYDVTVTAEFASIPIYNVSIDSEITGGTVTADKAGAPAGDTVTLTVTPDEGKRLQAETLSATYGTDEILPLTAGTEENNFTFLMPSGNVTVKATFITQSANSKAWDGSIDTSWYNAEDTSFEINTPAQLAGLASIANGTAKGVSQDIFTGKTITLKNNIDLGGVQNIDGTWDASSIQWVCISGGEATNITGKAFNGTFDGGGHIINNLYIERRDVGWQNYGGRNQGLFGIIDPDAVVKNLGVTGHVAANRSVAGIVGKNNGKVENCFNAASIYSTDSKGVGGIVGANWNNPTIINCYNIGTVSTGYSENPCGGIAGDNEALIENCYNAGKIGENKIGNLGGIVGNIKMNTPIIKNCYYNSALTEKGIGNIGTSEYTVESVEGKTAEEMKTADFAALLNGASGTAFVQDVKKINNGYPILLWQAQAANNYTFRLETATDNVKVNDTLVLDIYLDGANGAPLYGAQAELLIDTSKWEFVGEDESAVTVFNDFKAGVIESDSDKINKIKLIYVNPDQNNPGTITDTSLHIGQITLKATTKGTSNIALSEYKITHPNGDPLSNVSAEPIQITIISKSSSGGSTAPGTPVNKNPIVSKATDATGTATIKASEIKEAKTLTVNGNTKVDNAVLEFDAKAVEMIKAVGSDDVKVNLSKVESSKLTEEQKTQIASLIEEDTMKDRPVYSFNVTVGDEKVSDFNGGKVSISLDYKLKPGEDPEKIVIFHLKNDGTIEVLRNCKYDVKTGKLSFNVDSFSYFVVGYTDELKTTFTDVPLNAWYYESVYYLANKNIVKGRTETTFAPMQNITRAEFLQILYGMTKPNDYDFEDPAYTDVSKDAWYYNAVAWGTKEGVVAGSGGKFRPNDNVSRQEMAVMLNQFTDKVAKTKLNKASEAISFTDASNIASWAGSSVETMQQSGIISGFACDTGFRFAPAENATRAQAARMVAELLKQLEK